MDNGRYSELQAQKLAELQRWRDLFARALEREGVPTTRDDVNVLAAPNRLILGVSLSGGVQLRVDKGKTRLAILFAGSTYDHPLETWPIGYLAMGAVLTRVARDPEVVAALPPFSGPTVELTESLVEQIMTGDDVPGWLRQWAILRLGQTEETDPRISAGAHGCFL